jgi:ElaA protein
MARPMPVLAYARLRPGDHEDPDVVIDKILTSPARRGDGTAEMLIERALQAVAQHWPGRLVRVTAPVGLKCFYEQFGFRKTEGPFLEHGSPYIGLTYSQRHAQAYSSEARRARQGLSLVSTFELL